MADQPKPFRIGEFALIAKYFVPLAAAAPGALGLTDDAALIAVPAGQELVVSSDALVASVHFRPEDPPDLVARKALRVNLSDLAAMGAAPAGYTLATMLPRDIEEGWSFERLETVLRAILRAGAYELIVRLDVPARVAINEYVEIAHSFFGGREPNLVNGVLDKLAKERRQDELRTGD